MIRILSATVHTLPLRTRLPFRYGIVTVHQFEHCFVRVQVEVDGVAATGIAADCLAPKWFTKNPDTPIDQDVAEMKQVIAAACALAENAGGAATVFELWHRIYDDFLTANAPTPPLLLSFGVSLIERAVIDAFCRATRTTFADAVRENRLGVVLGAIHPDLQGREPAELLPALPLRRIAVRHTVGLIDPLESTSIEPPVMDDGLPQTLEACIRAYGLTHFKIKLCGDGARDRARLVDVAEVIQRNCRNYAFTLDGNENYHTVEAFRAAWQQIAAAPELGNFLCQLLFVEQPLHRDVALSEATGEALSAWIDRPAIIIDESDGELNSLRVALACGYTGTSHKNCKGVFKGIANACLAITNGALISGEDLCNVGPVALTQDLAVMATLGIAHVERNGHHYFCGLSMFPHELQASMAKAHSDLYRWHERHFATLDVRHGAINLSSVVDAPFGYASTVLPQALFADGAMLEARP